MNSDEDAPCDVCREKYSEPSNEMVFCDSCDICVHQACYGVSVIPAGDWFCKPCSQNIRPQCIFCPSKKGALKQTKKGNWAHVNCALWIPEVSFADPEQMDTIVNIEKIPKSRWSLNCSLCHVRQGACIQCYVKKCRTAYHVTCAFNANLHMEMQDCEGGEQDIKFETFCPTHTDLHASGQNPHTSTCSKSDSSKKRKLEKNENGKSIEDKIVTQLPQAQVSMEEENRASTSYDTGISVVSTPEKTMGDNGNNVQKMNDDRKVSAAELFTEQDIKNLSAISKGTARKSFALPSQKNQKLCRVISKLNGKMADNEKGKLSNKSKRASAPNKLPSPKKPRTKSTKQKTKPVIPPNPPTQFPLHNEGNNTTQNKQPDSTDPQFSEPHQQNFSNSSEFTVRQLFPTPDDNLQLSIPTFNEPKKLTNSNSINNLLSSASNGQQFLPSSSTSRNNQIPQSDIAAGFPASATSSTTSKNDNFDEFSKYIKSLLQNLSFKKTLRVQQKIIALVVKECGVSSDDEFDAISLSSDD